MNGLFLFQYSRVSRCYIRFPFPFKTSMRRNILTLTLIVCASRPVPAEDAHMCMITSFRAQPYVKETSDAILSQIEAYSLQENITLSIGLAAPAMYDTGAPASLVSLIPDRQIATGGDCATNEDNGVTPPCKVRQQGLDVAGALESCHASNPSARWIVLLEDDFAACDNALPRLLQTLGSLDPGENKFARFTQGGGGVAFPRENVPLYIKSVRDNILDKPCDRVLLEPWCDKQDFVFPNHLFRHVGRVSTVESRNSPEYREQYAGIRDNVCGEAIAV